MTNHGKEVKKPQAGEPSATGGILIQVHGKLVDGNLTQIRFDHNMTNWKHVAIVLNKAVSQALALDEQETKPQGRILMPSGPAGDMRVS